MQSPGDPAFRSALQRVLSLLAEVREGNHDARLEPTSTTDPLAPLVAGINEILEELARERRRSAGYRHELEERLAAQEMQRASMREISTPVIEAWQGVLCLPLVGMVDTERGEDVLNTLLGHVVERGARCVIVDVTGLKAIDADTGRWLLDLANAVRLLGARCLLTGIRGELASAIAQAEFDLTSLSTLGSVKDALERWVSTRSGGAAR
jgi:rsbT co-antagonist protein RsbR